MKKYEKVFSFKVENDYTKYIDVLLQDIQYSKLSLMLTIESLNSYQIDAKPLTKLLNHTDTLIYYLSFIDNKFFFKDSYPLLTCYFRENGTSCFDIENSDLITVLKTIYNTYEIACDDFVDNIPNTIFLMIRNHNLKDASITLQSFQMFLKDENNVSFLTTKTENNIKELESLLSKCLTYTDLSSDKNDFKKTPKPTNNGKTKEVAFEDVFLPKYKETFPLEIKRQYTDRTPKDLFLLFASLKELKVLHPTQERTLSGNKTALARVLISFFNLNKRVDSTGKAIRDYIDRNNDVHDENITKLMQNIKDEIDNKKND